MEIKHTAGNLLSKVYIKQATCHCIEFHLKTDHWTSSISTQQNTLIWLGWAAPKNSMNLQWNLCFWNALKQEVIPSFGRQVTEVLWLYFHLTLCLLETWKFKISLVKFIGCGFRTNTNILNYENSCSTARHSFSFKNRICISIETPEKSKWQRFTKKWIVSFEKASFETVVDLGEGSPLSSRSISATARVDIGEGAGLWNWWRLSVTYYCFRCLGGVECICSVNYRKHKKKACDFKLERIRTENKRGMTDWTKIFWFFFWRQNEYFWEQSRVSGA